MRSKFGLEVSFHETSGEPVVAYLRVREGTAAKTEEIREGTAFSDYNEDSLLLGIEWLAPCLVEVLERVSENEPEAVRRFLRHGVRQEMVLA